MLTLSLVNPPRMILLRDDSEILTKEKIKDYLETDLDIKIHILLLGDYLIHATDAGKKKGHSEDANDLGTILMDRPFFGSCLICEPSHYPTYKGKS